jgi:lysophospholipase L1-like esterase
VEVVKQIAKDRKVPLVDLHALSIKKCEELGPKGCEAISPTTRDGGVDRTHLNAAGAKLIAPLIAEELRRSVPDLGKHFRTDAAATE